MSLITPTFPRPTYTSQNAQTLPIMQYNVCHESVRQTLTNSAKTPVGQHGLKFCAGIGGGLGAGSQRANMEELEMEGSDGRAGGGFETGEEERGGDGRAGGGIERGEEERSGSMGTTSIVCAWWTGYGALHTRQDGRKVHAHTYQTTLKPTRPLVTGGRVRFLALPTTRAPVPVAHIVQYDPYEPHVNGVVLDVSSTRRGWAKVTVVNECNGNAVGIVDLDIPEVIGVTIGRYAASGEPCAASWIGEAPEGCLEWREREEEGFCGGRLCELQPAEQSGETNFRAVPKRRKGQGAQPTVNGPVGEGVAALHLWLKYEGYN
ncbi:hypothetical protein C8T65DRAFT_693299 [Cerioporus squamosus]|nr:hypothetical protein C8T65DRAFT_693299 [Cerioporus squamosus]